MVAAVRKSKVTGRPEYGSIIYIHSTFPVPAPLCDANSPEKDESSACVRVLPPRPWPPAPPCAWWWTPPAIRSPNWTETRPAYWLAQALQREGIQVGQHDCSGTYNVYHVKLANSITVFLQGPQGHPPSPHPAPLGYRQATARALEDVPPTCSQMVRSLVTGQAMNPVNDTVAAPTPPLPSRRRTVSRHNQCGMRASAMVACWDRRSVTVLRSGLAIVRTSTFWASTFRF